jgi:predicted transposase YbfD/YdcC
VKLFLDEPAHAADLASHRTVDAEHGRIETREASICTKMDWLQERHEWPGLAAFGKIVRTREMKAATGTATTSTETAYYLLNTELSPARFADVVQSLRPTHHSLHWVDQDLAP